MWGLCLFGHSGQTVDWNMAFEGGSREENWDKVDCLQIVRTIKYHTKNLGLVLKVMERP